MARGTGAGVQRPRSLRHEVVQDWLLDYAYGRLAPAQDAAVEAHVRSCAQCRAEGLGHLATERMQAMRHRSRAHNPLTTPLTVSLSILLALLAIFAGLIIYAANRNGSFQALFHQGGSSQGTLATVPTATPVPASTPVPVALKANGAVGPVGSVTLAASPDGTLLAVGTDTSGVEIYKAGKPFEHLYGFERFPAPGTLSWSSDGKLLAASGALTLYVWKIGSGSPFPVRLAPNPGTDLSIYDWAAGKAIGSMPSTIFAVSGFAQWGDKGQVTPAQPGSGAVGNIPDPSSPVFALWSGQQGIRVFRDQNMTVDIGISDADRAAHAAFLRWSPDGRYIVWGYPRLPVSSTLLDPTMATNGTPTANTAVGAPDPAFAAIINRVGQASDQGASAIVWPAPDGLRLAYFDATAAPTTFAIVDAQTTTPLAALPTDITMPTKLSLNALSWEATNPIRIGLTTEDKPANEYTPAA